MSDGSTVLSAQGHLSTTGQLLPTLPGRTRHQVQWGLSLAFRRRCVSGCISVTDEYRYCNHIFWPLPTSLQMGSEIFDIFRCAFAKMKQFLWTLKNGHLTFSWWSLKGFHVDFDVWKMDRNWFNQSCQPNHHPFWPGDFLRQTFTFQDDESQDDAWNDYYFSHEAIKRKKTKVDGFTLIKNMHILIHLGAQL